MSSVGVSEAANVLHNEEGRLDFRDQSEEVAEQLSARVIDGASADVAETLAGRAAEDAVDPSSRRSQKSLAVRVVTSSKLSLVVGKFRPNECVRFGSTSYAETTSNPAAWAPKEKPVASTDATFVRAFLIQ